MLPLLVLVAPALLLDDAHDSKNETPALTDGADFSVLYPGYKEWKSTTQSASSLQTQFSGGPRWAQVFARSTVVAKTKEVIEWKKTIASISKNDLKKNWTHLET